MSLLNPKFPKYGSGLGVVVARSLDLIKEKMKVGSRGVTMVRRKKKRVAHLVAIGCVGDNQRRLIKRPTKVLKSTTRLI